MLKFNKDVMGVFFSCVCLTHCLIGPMMLFLGVSSISFVFLEKEWIHYVLIAPMLVFAVWSLPSGFKIHQKPIPSVSGILGILMLILGFFSSEAYEEMFVIGTGCMLIIAHLYNRYLLIQFRKQKSQVMTEGWQT